jgi:hypothetical protein
MRSTCKFEFSQSRAAHKLDCLWWKAWNVRKPQYQYRPIDPKEEIRLLVIKPGTFLEPLKATVEHYRLSEVEDKYFALSYAWGKPEKTHQIQIGHYILNITKSLYMALKRFRQDPIFDSDTSLRRVIWVDAVSINQALNEEKCHQIQLMRPIYKSAHAVYIYLGENDRQIDLAIDEIEKSSIKEGPRGYPVWDVGEVVGGLGKFFNLPWFTRKWVIQEFALAKETVMVWGHRKIDFTVIVEKLFTPLLRFLALSQNAPSQMKAFFYGRQRILDLWNAQYCTRKEMCVPLLQWLQIFRTWETSLKRDHLFAFLGLAASDGEDLEFAPDYDEPLNTVVKRYARRFIERQEIYMLDFAGLSPTSPQSPSWIPPWVQPHNENPTETLLTFFEYSTYTLQTTYSAATHRQADAQVLEESCLLQIRGVLIDTLREITKPIHRDRFLTRFERIRSFYEWILATDPMLSSLKQYYTGESLREVQLRTYLGNRLPSDHIPESKRLLTQGDDKSIEKLANPGVSPSQTYIDAYIDVIDEMVDLVHKYKGEPINWDSPKGNMMAEALVLWHRRSIPLNKCGFLSKHNFFGGVPEGTSLEDMIFLPYGSQMPYVVRPSVERPCTYRLIGGCYVHGIMEGEMENFNFEEMTIDIY